jgi:hypothetical protein
MNIQNLNCFLDSQEFYEACQAYRHAGDPLPNAPGLPSATEAFERLKLAILTAAIHGMADKSEAQS